MVDGMSTTTYLTVYPLLTPEINQEIVSNWLSSSGQVRLWPRSPSHTTPGNNKAIPRIQTKIRHHQFRANPWPLIWSRLHVSQDFCLRVGHQWHQSHRGNRSQHGDIWRADSHARRGRSRYPRQSVQISSHAWCRIAGNGAMRACTGYPKTRQCPKLEYGVHPYTPPSSGESWLPL